MKPYARIRRDLRDHLPGIDPAPFKLYIALHLYADHRTGEVTMTIAELSGATGLPRSTVQRALEKLEEYPYIRRPKSGLIVIEKYFDGDEEKPAGGIFEGEEKANEKPAGGIFEGEQTVEKKPAGGISHEREKPAGGTKKPAGGKSTPLSREEKEKEKNPPTPLPDWSPWPDAEAARDAILDAYPKGKVNISGARAWWQNFVTDPSANGKAKRMFAAAKIIQERCPPAKIPYLPNARDFLDRWEDDWAAIVEGYRAEVGRSRQSADKPEYDIQPRKEGLRQ